MIAIELFLYLLLAISFLMIGYQVILGISATYVKPIEQFNAKLYRRFAIVIPAHNEEKMIAKTIYSLFSLNYPNKLFDVIVVADNCTDQTAEISTGLGATVWERTDDKKRGKGYALSWGFEKLLQSSADYDAVIVIDSDSLISGNFLTVMNDYLEQGMTVIQSNDLVLPQPGNWSIESTRIGFILTNFIKPLGRKNFGLFAGLRGNGMCFRTDVLRDVPWQAWSLTEDVEFGLTLILKGYKIEFSPEAVVWAQMPVHSRNAESQRSRWERGRSQITKNFAGIFFKKAIRHRSIRFFDVFIDLITPPFVNMMLFVSIMTVLSFLMWIFGWIAPTALWLWVLLIFASVFHLLLGLKTAKADRMLYKSMLYIPIYILWKIKMYIKALSAQREMKWIRTTRDI